jgi:hypothetical protein
MNLWIVKLKAEDSDGKPMWVEMTSFGPTLTGERWKATLFDDSVTAWRHAEDAGTELGMAFQAHQASRRDLIERAREEERARNDFLRMHAERRRQIAGERTEKKNEKRAAKATKKAAQVAKLRAETTCVRPSAAPAKPPLTQQDWENLAATGHKLAQVMCYSRGWGNWEHPDLREATP